MPTPADLAQALWAALQHARHYRPGHPASELAVRRCAAVFREAAPVQIVVEPRRLVIRGQPLATDDAVAASLRAYLEARRVPALVVGPDATDASVAALIGVLAREPEEIIAAGGLLEALQEAGAAGVLLLEQPSAPAAARDAYDAAVETAAAVAAAVGRGDPVDLPKVREAAADVVRLAREDPLSLWARVADRSHDETDPAHAVNTAALSVFVARALGVAEPALTDLAAAALVHDVGLAVLPPARRLAERTAAGPAASWTHPALGAFLLRRLAATDPVLPVVAAEHHLPALGGEACAPACLVSLADYVDALTCGRAPAHRAAAMGPLVARLLGGDGPAFDPSHVRVLARLLCEAASAGVPLAAPDSP